MRSLGLISSSTPWICSSPFHSSYPTSLNRFTLKFPASLRRDSSNSKKLSSFNLDSHGGKFSKASISVLEDQSINTFKLQTSMAFTSFVIAAVPTLVIIPQSICSRYGLAIGATVAPFVRVLVFFCLPVAWPISKLLDFLLGHHRE